MSDGSVYISDYAHAHDKTILKPQDSTKLAFLALLPTQNPLAKL